MVYSRVARQAVRRDQIQYVPGHECGAGGTKGGRSNEANHFKGACNEINRGAYRTATASVESSVLGIPGDIMSDVPHRKICWPNA